MQGAKLQPTYLILLVFSSLKVIGILAKKADDAAPITSK